MNLIYSTQKLRGSQYEAPQLLNMGLREPPISLTAVEDGSLDMDIWGDYHFFLLMDWVKSHASQFREYSSRQSQEFKEFVAEYGFEASPKIENESRVADQIISVEEIPPNAIEKLVIQVNARQIPRRHFPIDNYFDGHIPRAITLIFHTLNQEYEFTCKDFIIGKSCKDEPPRRHKYR